MKKKTTPICANANVSSKESFLGYPQFLDRCDMICKNLYTNIPIELLLKPLICATIGWWALFFIGNVILHHRTKLVLVRCFYVIGFYITQQKSPFLFCPYGLTYPLHLGYAILVIHNYILHCVALLYVVFLIAYIIIRSAFGSLTLYFLQ